MELIHLHPIIIHFVIALYLVGLGLEFVGFLWKKDGWIAAGKVNGLLAAFFAVFAVLSGLLAESGVPHNDAAHQVMENHELLGYIVAGGIISATLWRFFHNTLLHSKFVWGYFILNGLIALLLLSGAYLGGQLVYTYGVAVKAVKVESQEHFHSAPHQHGIHDSKETSTQENHNHSH